MARLVVDLRFDASGMEQTDRAFTVGFHRLAEAARHPRELLGLLRSQTFSEAVVVEDDLPPSAVQAIVALLASLARTRRFRVGPDDRSIGRIRFIGRGLARAALAIPREMRGTLKLGGTIRRASRRAYDIPRRADEPESVTYLRVEPTLRWMGKYVGGAATHTTGVINGFSDNGMEVTVVGPEEPPGIEPFSFIRVPVERIYQLVRALTNTDYSEAVVKAAVTSPPDFVYQRYTLGSLAGLELAERLQVPLVQEFNGSEIWVDRHWGDGRLRMERRLAALERRNLTDASLIVVVSDALRVQLAEMGIDSGRVLVNPNGVDIERLAGFREDTPAKWRAREGLAAAPTVGFIGTFGQWHGVHLLPAMAEAVRARVPEARWIVIGDGILRPGVEAELEQRGLGEVVKLTGLVEHERALALLAACDVCVSPHVPNPDGSPFFGSPTKLFEYMGLAKPIVASDLEQIGDVLDHDRTGLLCPPENVDAAATEVARLLADEALRERLGKAALEEARRSYSWSAHTRRILDALARGGH